MKINFFKFALMTLCLTTSSFASTAVTKHSLVCNYEVAGGDFRKISIEIGARTHEGNLSLSTLDNQLIGTPIQFDGQHVELMQFSGSGRDTRIQSLVLSLGRTGRFTMRMNSGFGSEAATLESSLMSPHLPSPTPADCYYFGSTGTRD